MVKANKPEKVLKEFYNRNGCLRVRPDDPIKGRHGGVELRLVVGNMEERKAVIAALKALRIRHGKVYRKQLSRKQWVVPVYSRENILNFLKSVRPHGVSDLMKKVRASGKRK